jgi:hypothetical protein
MALVHCILGKFLGVVCHCFPLNVHYRKNNRISSEVAEISIVTI